MLIPFEKYPKTYKEKISNAKALRKIVHDSLAVNELEYVLYIKSNINKLRMIAKI